MPNKKRKVVSPLEGFKSNKIIKYTKENSDKSISKEKDEAEEKCDTDCECIDLISDQEEKDLGQSSKQDCETKVKPHQKKMDTTPKRDSLTKGKILKKSRKKSSALTKFLMKTDSELMNSSHKATDESTDCPNTSACEENSEILSSSQSPESSLHTSCVNEEMDNIVTEDPNICQDSDSDIVSLNNEATSELDKSRTSISEESSGKPAIPTTPKSNKDEKIMSKKLTPRQLEKRQEIARKREEKAKLKMVVI